MFQKIKKLFDKVEIDLLMKFHFQYFNLFDQANIKFKHLACLI